MAGNWIWTGLMGAALIGSAPALAAGGGAAKKGPQGIPYHCSDGRSLRVVYGDSGPRAAAQLAFDSGEKLTLQPTGSYGGKSYMLAREAGPALLWKTDGLGGVLAEAAPDPALEAREIARCDRLGWGGNYDKAEGVEAEPEHESSDSHH
jgi:hypothetical protein